MYHVVVMAVLNTAPAVLIGYCTVSIVIAIIITSIYVCDLFNYN